MFQREYNWLFVTRTNYLPNAAWVLVFNDAAAINLGSPLATEQSYHRPLEWMSRSCYLHPGNTGTGSFQRSKNKFSDFIQVKNN